MRLLLDTHIILWTYGAPHRLSATARKLILDPDNDLCFSSITICEIAIKRALGRPDFADDPAAVLARLHLDRVEEIPITGQHGLILRDLPLLHRDPFDRLLVAQAIVENAQLVTADRAMPDYDAPLLRC